MPIYEYICEDCQTHFEKIVLNKMQEIACPKCAGKKNAIQLSVFSAANGSSNGVSAKSSGGSSSGGGSRCGGGWGGAFELFCNRFFSFIFFFVFGVWVCFSRPRFSLHS